MARRKAETLEHDPSGDAGAEGFNPIDDDGDDDDIALQQFLGSLEGDAGVAVTVYRVRPNKPLSYLFKCGATDFSLDKLRDDHGGGDFRVRAYRGRNLIANKAITVEPPIAKPAVPTVTGYAPNSGTNGVELERVLERQAMESRALMLELGKLMLTTRGHSDPRKEFFETLTMVKTLLPPPATTSGDQMETFMKGISFARDVAEETGGGNDDGIGAIAKLAEKYLPQVIALAQQPRQPNPNPNPNAPRPQPMNPMMAMIRQQLDVMNKAAKAGQPNDPFVDEILDQLPPARVEELINHADPVGVLISIHPGVAEVRGWYADLIEKIKAALTEDDGAGDDRPDANPK